MKGTKTLYVDVMLSGRYVFTLRYKYCPLFKLDDEDIYNQIIKKRPTLKGQPFEMFFD